MELFVCAHLLIIKSVAFPNTSSGFQLCLFFHSSISAGVSNHLGCVCCLWRNVRVCVCLCMSLCVFTVPLLAFFISNQWAIDSPDFAPAQLFHSRVSQMGLLQ